MSLGPDVGSRVPHLGSWVSGPGSHPQDEFRVSGLPKVPGLGPHFSDMPKDLIGC